MTTTPAVAAAMLLGAALVPSGPPSRHRWRELTTVATTAAEPPPRLRPAWLVVGIGAVGAVGWALGGAAAGLVVTGLAGAAAVGLRRGLTGRAGERTEDGPELAGCWELLAACLEAGLPVAGAVLATATPLTGAAGHGMRRVAGLLELGADPVDAWRTVEHRQALAAFARAAARSAGTGAALARVARTECARLRAELTDAAQARAQRAAVLITGPLGLCFLPAFLVLGIAPVVIGLAGEALARW
jgi:Type II secretion system (T2SS), protein F